MSNANDRAPSLGDFLTYEQFLAFWELAQNEEGKVGQSDRDAYQNMLAQVARPALAAFLKAKLECGELSPIEGAEGHSTFFLDAWNEVVADIPREDPYGDPWSQVAQRFDHRLIFGGTYKGGRILTGYGNPPPSGPEEAYRLMIAKADGGNFRWWDHSEQEVCAHTGQRYLVDVEGWKVTLGTLRDDAKSDFLEPMQPVAKPGIQCLSAEFEGGEWLVCDWFRIPAFTEAMKAEEDAANENINSTSGREARTRRYLERGIVHVSVGNTLPSILFRDGALIVGGMDLESEECDGRLGYVCTDLWWTTALPRETLVSIVAGLHGRAEAERIVSDYVTNSPSPVTSFHLPPGRWHLHFSGHRDLFSETFRPDGLDIEGIEPMLVLADRPLVGDAEPEAEPDAGVRPGR